MIPLLQTPLKFKIILLLFPAVVLYGCTTNPARDEYSPANYEEQKMTLGQQEKQNPMQFLSSTGTYRKNLFGRFVVDGTISNTATVATYKDVVLEVRFYSRTETLLDTKQYTICEYYPPGSRKTFNLKMDAAAGTSKIGWDIVDAGN